MRGSNFILIGLIVHFLRYTHAHSTTTHPPRPLNRWSLWMWPQREGSGWGQWSIDRDRDRGGGAAHAGDGCSYVSCYRAWMGLCTGVCVCGRRGGVHGLEGGRCHFILVRLQLLHSCTQNSTHSENFRYLFLPSITPSQVCFLCLLSDFIHYISFTLSFGHWIGLDWSSKTLYIILPPWYFFPNSTSIALTHDMFQKSATENDTCI